MRPSGRSTAEIALRGSFRTDPVTDAAGSRASRRLEPKERPRGPYRAFALACGKGPRTAERVLLRWRAGLETWLHRRQAMRVRPALHYAHARASYGRSPSVASLRRRTGIGRGSRSARRTASAICPRGWCHTGSTVLPPRLHGRRTGRR